MKQRSLSLRRPWPHTTQKNTLLRAGDSSIVVVVVDTRNIFSTSPASRANGKEISVEAAALPIELQKAG